MSLDSALNMTSAIGANHHKKDRSKMSKKELLELLDKEEREVHASRESRAQRHEQVNKITSAYME